MFRQWLVISCSHAPTDTPWWECQPNSLCGSMTSIIQFLLMPGARKTHFVMAIHVSFALHELVLFNLALEVTLYKVKVNHNFSRWLLSILYLEYNMRNVPHFDALIFTLRILYEKSVLHFACNTLFYAYCKYYC